MESIGHPRPSYHPPLGNWNEPLHHHHHNRRESFGAGMGGDGEMRMMVESIFNDLLEEMIWKISVSEVKRAKNFHIFSAEQELYANEKKSGNEKNNLDPVHDCPVCGREVSAARFAPHLSKCLGIGGRGQASKKSIRSDFSESESVTKGSSHTPQDFASASRNRQGGNMKRRGRPPKKQATVPLSPAEHEALLSNAITNVTQRLHLQNIGVGGSTTSSHKTAPHPLSQSHIATPPVIKPKKKKKKRDSSTRNRSRNSSQASSSSDSEEEEEEEEGDEEEEGEGEGELEEGGDDQQTSTPAAGRMDDDNEGSNGAYSNGNNENPSISPASIAPAPTPASSHTVLPRPVLKRRSSSQADSTDGSDSD
ncbi:hypothetical protein MJO29_000200 [Puccinia striiformis f. sp. tritici]|uniref:SAGA-associated factor 11 n=1 Tax=Puccinia striiformis f. sp. tritici PST-78 TaxID=1165861 RepID=A0A0L0V408_9BASI|nr:hypothetical protein Pst134EA_000199 [Puccinia striiformis f. sp. tritici]KAH9473122.1 hypothetical protein Pst134EA_000199 [Puccinia striiformis f. sp. tritici]KAI7966923.1 hypothetical protein MJO29_000200 [Puccinia striiformis f. sp. tritici]KNE93719.1 hypothetical protein PSTG_12907 [Puccinia striiformis f. sp. tritici PST-78]